MLDVIAQEELTDVYGVNGFIPYCKVLDWSLVVFLDDYLANDSAERNRPHFVYARIRKALVRKEEQVRKD